MRAMASDMSLSGSSVVPIGSDPVVDQALAVLTSVHEACTRFDPDSPLMRANARPDEWHVVPLVLLAAVREAHRAYRRTDGRFDPRILGDLVRLGYDRSLAFGDGDVTTTAVDAPHVPLPRWTPRFRYGRRPELHLGGLPIDLGGIGKSLAVRWASEELQEHFEDFLLDAGGDCYCEGSGPEDDGWRVASRTPWRRTAAGRSGREQQGLRHLLGPAPALAIRHERSPSSDRPDHRSSGRRGPDGRHRRRRRPHQGRGRHQVPLPRRSRSDRVSRTRPQDGRTVDHKRW